MQLLAITPIKVSVTELARRQSRYDRLAPGGISVRLENLGDGADLPSALDTAADIAASEDALLRRFATVDVVGVDGFLPDCVLDPVVDDADSLARPVFGIGKLTAHFLAGLGLRIGAVARNRAIAAELDHRLHSYGLFPDRETAVLDLSVDDIADDAAWSTAVERAIHQLDCDVVINACSAVDVSAKESGPVLLDPTHTALQLLGVQASMTGRTG